MPDVKSAAYAKMGCTEVQYSIFELEALQAQEKLVAKRTGGETMSWSEYCKICGDGVPVDNYVKGDGSLLAEKEKEEEAKRTQKKVKPTAKPRAAPAPSEPMALVAEAGAHQGGGARRPSRREQRLGQWTIS